MSFGITRALREIDTLNAILHEKCSRKYALELRRYQYIDVDSAVYHPDAEYDIILCLNYNGKCISSVSGLYHDGKTQDETKHYVKDAIEIISKTKPQYEGRKFNLFLRFAFIYLVYFLRASPSIKTVVSFSKNTISTYAMYKYFGATNDDLTDFIRENHISDSTITIDDMKRFHDYFNRRHSKKEEDAIRDLDELLESGQTLEDFGWETREEAIQFIIDDFLNSMPYSIPLEVDLEKTAKEEWLEKLKTIAIRCDPPTPTAKSRKRKRASNTKSVKKTRR
jgi:hypothetical protein